MCCLRYADKNPTMEGFVRPCNHNSKSWNCNTITIDEIKQRRSDFYKSSNKIEQDQKLSHMIAVCEPLRNRSRATTLPGKAKKKTVSVSYIWRKPTGGYTPVCQKFLLATLGIKKDRLVSVAKTIYAGGIPKENRGGDRKSKKSEEKKQKIREFIKKFPATESHYGRQKSKRIYLSCDLSISKICSLYNESVTAVHQASPSMFRRVFLSDFNIGFKSPACDICSTCVNLKNAIKQNQDARKKNSLMAQYRLHKLRANAFYQLAKRELPSVHTACFDLQQVHPLPKTPIGEAFYKRQLSFYSFCCVGMDSRHPLFFTWTEDQAGRGCSEIGSALLTYLRSLTFHENSSIDTVRLFCDGCGGQNKNSHIVHLLAYWLLREAPANISNIELIFPVRGHSFLPADRAFGRVEKILKKQNVITTPEQYNEIYKTVGTVMKLGPDWQVYNIKDLSTVYTKIKGIQAQKRLFLKKLPPSTKRSHNVIHYNAQPFYIFEHPDPSYVPLAKKGKKETSITLKQLELKINIKSAKKKDVKELLEKHFNRTDGDNIIKWQDLPELEFYRKILEEDAEDADENEEIEQEEDEEQCNCLDDDCALHV